MEGANRSRISRRLVVGESHYMKRTLAKDSFRINSFSSPYRSIAHIETVVPNLSMSSAKHLE